MVPSYGHHGAKIFVRGKPIRFVYKEWILCSADDYLYQASIYSGKSDRPDNVGLGQHVVLSFAALVDNKAQYEL